MPRKQSDDSFSEEEAARRLEAALRGARISGHKSLKDISKRNGESRRVNRKKQETKLREK